MKLKYKINSEIRHTRCTCIKVHLQEKTIDLLQYTDLVFMF